MSNSRVACSPFQSIRRRTRQARASDRFWLRLAPYSASILLVAGILLGTSAQATTLVRCKIDGKTVYSDTDCPRSTHLKNALPASKPIRISRKSKSSKRG